jgi:hypothetical protein
VVAGCGQTPAGAFLGLQESANVLGPEPRQLVGVVLCLAVLDPMHEHVCRSTGSRWPATTPPRPGRTRRTTTGILPIGRCGMLGGCSTLSTGMATPPSVEQMFGCV